MAKTTYEIWALGYNKDNTITDIEEFLGEHATEKAAVKHAKKFNYVQDVFSDEVISKYLDKFDYLEINVEKVVDHGDYIEALDTIYSQNIYFREG